MATRESQAAIAFNVYMFCWKRGYVLCRMDDQVLALGGFIRSADEVRNTVRWYKNFLLPRTPPIHDENARR